MGAPRIKHPLLAALLTVPVAGLGHFYAGAWVRGFAVFLGVYFSWALLDAAGTAWTLLPMPFLIGLAAWDAWRVTFIENTKERLAAAAGTPPPAWLLWPWALCRTAWIALLPPGFAFVSAGGALELVRGGHLVWALAVVAASILVLYLGWLMAVETWDALRGKSAPTRGALTDELGGTLLVAGVGFLMFMIAFPMFRPLVRKSGEGAMKNGLAELRAAVAVHKAAHDGAAPASLEALVESKSLAALPFLWGRFSEIPHPKTSEARAARDGDAADTGKWGYAGGTVFIDCTHTDNRGSAWTSY